LTQKRRTDLDDAEKILEKIDILHLEFAKRAAVSTTKEIVLSIGFMSHCIKICQFVKQMLDLPLKILIVIQIN